MSLATLRTTDIPGLRLKTRGKVRDVYDLGERLLIAATDRLSAFDVVLPTPIPSKGRVLTQMSAWWFIRTRALAANHLITADMDELSRELGPGVTLDREAFDGRLMLVRAARRVDAECVVRGWLAGSAWKEYRRSGTIAGRALPPGLREFERLPEPLFTPTTKADEGHDRALPAAEFAALVGQARAAELERLSLLLYDEAARTLDACGLVLADTKFEFGELPGPGGAPALVVIDELLTPDSSRLWDKAGCEAGVAPESFDKQFVRDYLEAVGWDKTPPGPELPAGVVEATSRRYLEAFERLLLGGKP